VKTKHFIFWIWVFLPFLALSQAPEIDSLEKVLTRTHNDTARLDILGQLSQLYFYIDLDRSKLLSEELLETAEKLNADEYICLAYACIGQWYGQKDLEIDSAVAFSTKALRCYEAQGDSLGKSTMLRQIGTAYLKSGLHVQALPLFQEAYTIAESMKDTAELMGNLMSMAIMQQSRSESQKAVQSLLKARTYAQALGLREKIGIIDNNIGYIYYKAQVYDSARVYYEKSIATSRALGRDLAVVTTLANLGGIYIEAEEYQRAQVYLDEAYEIAQAKDFSYGKGLALRYMATSEASQNRHSNAVELARAGLLAYGEIGRIDYVRDLYFILCQSYEKLNRPDSALVYLKAFHTLNDSIFQSEREQQIQRMEISYAVQQKEVENKLLKAEQAIIQQELANSTYLSIGLIIALALACGWAIAIFRNSQAKKRMNSLLEAQVAARTKDLEVANKQLEQANYELKTFNYIASHDLKEPIRNVGNYVSLIKRRLPEEIRNQMGDFFDIISQSTSLLYSLIEDFAAYTALSKEEEVVFKEVDMGLLLSNVENGMESFMQERKGQVSRGELPTILTNSSLMYVALKNLIENGIKFNESPTPTVNVQYNATSTHHQLVISDNGIGIEGDYFQRIFIMFKRLHSRSEYPGTGMGLSLVKLAVGKLDGEVEVRSTKGEGSTFILSLPKET